MRPAARTESCVLRKRTRDAHGPIVLDLKDEFGGGHALDLLERAGLQIEVQDGAGVGDHLVPTELGPVG